MRLEDATVSVVADFDQPIEKVWALLTDVERMAGLGPEHTTAVWATDRRGPGARFDGTNSVGTGTWTVPCFIATFDAPTHYAWTVGDPDSPSSTWGYQLEPRDGGSRVTQTFRHGPGFSFLRRNIEANPDTADEVIASRCDQLRANMAAVLAAAAALLANQQPSRPSPAHKK